MPSSYLAFPDSVFKSSSTPGRATSTTLARPASSCHISIRLYALRELPIIQRMSRVPSSQERLLFNSSATPSGTTGMLFLKRCTINTWCLKEYFTHSLSRSNIHIPRVNTTALVNRPKSSLGFQPCSPYSLRLSQPPSN